MSISQSTILGLFCYEHPMTSEWFSFYHKKSWNSWIGWLMNINIHEVEDFFQSYSHSIWRSVNRDDEQTSMASKKQIIITKLISNKSSITFLSQGNEYHFAISRICHKHVRYKCVWLYPGHTQSTNCSQAWSYLCGDYFSV